MDCLECRDHANMQIIKGPFGCERFIYNVNNDEMFKLQLLLRA